MSTEMTPPRRSRSAPPLLRLTTLGMLVAALGIPGQAAGQSPPVPDDSLLVSTAWLAARLDDPAIVIVQIERNPATWAEGHLPGARPLLLADIVTSDGGLASELRPVPVLDSVLEAAGISNGSRVIIYGEPLAAARLFFTLDYLGLGSRAAILDGGLARWRADGQPLTVEPREQPRGVVEPRVRPETLVDRTWIRERLGQPGLALLDARPPSEFSGEVAGDGILRPGHIPGAGNFFWRETLTGEPAPTLRPAEALALDFRRLGVAQADQVVVYCRTGVQASWLYFVARYLGHSPRLYDGSYLDWSGDESLPVDRPDR